MGKFGSAALWGRARRGLGAVRGRGSRLRGRWSFRRLGFGARGRAAVAPITVLALASHALGRGTVRCRAGTRRRWGGGMRGPWVERSRVACAGVYAVPARAGWGRVHLGAALQGFGRAHRQRVSGAEDAGSVGVCLPGANNVMNRTHLRQDARALSRSLERSLPPPLSLSRSLSLRSLARALALSLGSEGVECASVRRARMT